MTESAFGRSELEYEADQAAVDVLRRGRREPPLEEQVHGFGELELEPRFECAPDDVDEAGGFR